MLFFSFFFTLFFAFSTSFLHAESEIRMRGLENRVQTLEQNQKLPSHAITKNAGPRVKRGLDMFLFGEFLYWTGRLDSLSYAKTGVRHSLLSSPDQGSVYAVDWEWNPGFQVGIGWTLCHGGWDMQLKYTWFYTSPEGSITGDIRPSFAITARTLRITDPFDNANAIWDLHYQVGDLELGRNYFVHRYLKLRPFIGIKGTWQKQDYKAFYEGGILETNIFYGAKINFDHRIWGLGPRIGLNSSWHFLHWISLYGDFALTGMWLRYKIDRVDTFFLDQIEEPGSSLNELLHLTKPVVELGLGLRLDTSFCCRRFHILLQAGWEAQVWPNQTLYISLEENLNRFDLILHGLTAKLRFDF